MNSDQQIIQVSPDIWADLCSSGAVAELGDGFFKEANLPGVFAKDKFQSRMHRFIESGETVVLASFNDAALTGLLGGMLVDSIITDTIVLNEAFWYVRPEYRKTGIGLQLLTRFISIGRQLGVSQVIMAHLELAEQSRAIEVIYKRLKFVALETHFVLNLWQ